LDGCLKLLKLFLDTRRRKFDGELCVSAVSKEYLGQSKLGLKICFNNNLAF